MNNQSATFNPNQSLRALPKLFNFADQARNTFIIKHLGQGLDNKVTMKVDRTNIYFVRNNNVTGYKTDRSPISDQLKLHENLKLFCEKAQPLQQILSTKHYQKLDFGPDTNRYSNQTRLKQNKSTGCGQESDFESNRIEIHTSDEDRGFNKINQLSTLEASQGYLKGFKLKGNMAKAHQKSRRAISTLNYQSAPLVKPKLEYNELKGYLEQKQKPFFHGNINSYVSKHGVFKKNGLYKTPLVNPVVSPEPKQKENINMTSLHHLPQLKIMNLQHHNNIDVSREESERGGIDEYVRNLRIK